MICSVGLESIFYMISSNANIMRKVAVSKKIENKKRGDFN